MMKTQEQWIGIDVSKNRLDVAVYPLGKRFRVDHTEAGRAELIQQLAAYAVAGIVLESTGGLERAVMADLEAAQSVTRRVNPFKVRCFAKADGRLAKTDPIDADLLAYFGCKLQPAVTLLPDAATQELQALVTRRQPVVELLTMEKNRLDSCERWIRDSVQQVIDQLETAIEFLNQRLATLSVSQPAWAERLAILTSVKGIGPVTSQALLVYLPELGQRSTKAIAAVVGVAPFNQDSGKSKGQRRIQGGRKALRSLLYMATLSATVHNPVIRAHYQQLLQRGKSKRVALIACLRKLLGILNAMVRDQQPWRESTDQLTANNDA
jgi:transposase